jgi:hypothetical protein
MARGFGATLGAGTTDRIASALAAHATQRSYAIRSLKNGDGGGSQGRLWTVIRPDTNAFDVFDYSGGVYRYIRSWTTQIGIWSITPPSNSVWHSLVLTYNGGATTNTPVIYVDGASVTVTPVLAHFGSLDTTGTVFQIGNEVGGIRNWDGSLAEFAVWDRLLTATEANRLGIGYSPAFFPTSRVEYIPMRIDNVGQAGTPTITGTVVQPHPPTTIDTMPVQTYGRAALLAH